MFWLLALCTRSGELSLRCNRRLRRGNVKVFLSQSYGPSREKVSTLGPLALGQDIDRTLPINIYKRTRTSRGSTIASRFYGNTGLHQQKLTTKQKNIRSVHILVALILWVLLLRDAPKHLRKRKMLPLGAKGIVRQY